jgi:hypothetical protein
MECRPYARRLGYRVPFLRRVLRSQHGHPQRECVDLLYELPYALYERFHGHAGNGQSALLALIKDSIRKTYTVSDTRSSEPVPVLRSSVRPIAQVQAG